MTTNTPKEQRHRAAIPLSPILATQVAGGLLGLRDDGCGWRVAAMRALIHLPYNARWAAAFVQDVGHRAHLDHAGHRSSWPLPLSGGFHEMHRFALARQVVTDTPMEGDIALLCDRTTGTYRQGGYVVDVKGAGVMDDIVRPHLRILGDADQVAPPERVAYFDCITIEGDTNLFGAPGGNEVCRVYRRWVPSWKDCFIRWVELDARGVSATPWERTEDVMGRVRLGEAA